MKMTSEKQLQLLEETITYYTENPLRRCVTNDEDGNCFYSGKKNLLSESQGCAIGRLLTPELAEELDNLGWQFTLRDVFDKLPKEIRKYTKKFLDDLQGLHDNRKYWNDNGLTDLGEIVIKQFELKIKNGKYLKKKHNKHLNK